MYKLDPKLGVKELDPKLGPNKISKEESKLGPDWIFRVVWEGKANSRENRRKQGIWISPIQHIKFRLCTHACKFEELKIMYNNNEVGAWKVEGV